VDPNEKATKQRVAHI